MRLVIHPMKRFHECIYHLGNKRRSFHCALQQTRAMVQTPCVNAWNSDVHSRQALWKNPLRAYTTVSASYPWLTKQTQTHAL